MRFIALFFVSCCHIASITTLFAQATTLESVILDNGSANPFIRFNTPNGEDQFIVGFSDELGIYVNDDYKFFIRASARSFQMVLDDEGTILKGDLNINPAGVGTGNIVVSKGNLLVNEGNLVVNGTVDMGSSRTIKDNIIPLTFAESRNTLAGLDPMKFNYIKNPDEQVLGFIAEDVPDLVASEGRRTLGTMDIVAVLTKVVKEQQEMIEDLSKRIALLEGNQD